MLLRFVVPSLVVVCIARPALADDPPPVLPAPVLPAPVASPASVAFDQGMALADKHKWGAALAAFRGAYTLEPTPMSALHVGECELELGHYDAAELDFRTLAGATLPEGAPPAFEEARASAKEQLAKLDKLGRLRITLQGQSEGAAITVDGAPYTPGEVRRVRPGKHVVRVTEQGRDSVDALVDVAEGEHTTAAVVVPPAPSISLATQSSEPPAAPANQGLVVGGMALTIIGGMAVVAGSFAFLFSFGLGSSQRSTLTYALPLGGGACFMAAGIPMIVVGSDKSTHQHNAFTPPAPRVPTLTFSF